MIPIHGEIKQHQQQDPKLIHRGTLLQAPGQRSAPDAPSSEHLHQHSLRGQNGRQQGSFHCLGTPEIRECGTGATGLEALPGRLQKADGLEIADPLVVRRATRGFRQHCLGLSIRIAGIIVGSHFQKRQRIAREPVGHLDQERLEPALARSSVPDQFAKEQIAVTVAGIGTQARGDQLDRNPEPVLDPMAQQPTQLIPRRSEVVDHAAKLEGGPGQRFEHAASRNRSLPTIRILGTKGAEYGQRGSRFEIILRPMLDHEPDAGEHGIRPVSRENATRHIPDRRKTNLRTERGETGCLQKLCCCGLRALRQKSFGQRRDSGGDSRGWGVFVERTRKVFHLRPPTSGIQAKRTANCR